MNLRHSDAPGTPRGGGDPGSDSDSMGTPLILIAGLTLPTGILLRVGQGIPSRRRGIIRMEGDVNRDLIAMKSGRRT